MTDPTERAAAFAIEHPAAMTALDQVALKLGVDMVVAQLSSSAAREMSTTLGQEIPPDSFLCCRADPERRAHPIPNPGPGDMTIVTLDGRVVPLD